MPDTNTDWDAAADVDDVQDVPEYIPAPLGAPVSDIAPVDVKAFTQMMQDGVERERLIGKDGVEIKSPIEQANEFTDKLVDAQASALEGAPVSNSNEPINLADPQPSVLAVLHLNGVDVISTPDRIQVVREGAGLDAVAPPAAAPIMTERMQDKVTAEQEAGRKALARNQARAVSHPKPEKDAEELRREGQTTTVYRPTDMSNVNQRHLLNTPDPKKGAGY